MVETRSLGPLEPKRLVNRDTEIRAIGAALASKEDAPRIFYFTGGAGVGKSRLLHEARKKYKEQCTFAGFYDFDDTELHSNSALEQRILQVLDPKPFEAFRAKRLEFVQARRSGVKEEILEKMRQELAKLFVQGINEISAQKKLLFCFDTVETLQREGDTVQFPEQIQKAIDKLAIEMLGWLTKNLPQMRNVVVLLSGRPKPGLHEQFEKAFGSVYQPSELDNFDSKYVKEYLEVMAETYEDAGEQAFARQFRQLATQPERIYAMTKGQPILLSFITDLIHYGVRYKYLDLSEPLPANITPQHVKNDLMELVKNGIDDDIKLVLPYIALLRKGVTPAILHEALEDQLRNWDLARCEQVLESMRGLSFTKPIPSNRKLPLERMHLHDEVYDVMGEKEIHPHPEWYVPVCERMIAFYSNAVDAAETALKEWQKNRRELERQAKETGSEIEDEEKAFDEQSDLTAQVNRLKATRLYYQLLADPFKGYAEYSRVSDQAIINHQVGLDMMLRDEMLRYFDLTNRDNWRLKRAEKVKGTKLSRERIMRGAAIRWVQRLNAHGQSGDAITMAQILQTDAKLRAQLREKDELPKEDPLFDAIVKTYEGEAYLKLDTSQTIRVSSDAIELFENADLEGRDKDLKTQLRPRHLGRAYNDRGYAHAREYRFHEAEYDYKEALPLYRAIGLPHRKAGILVNLAFAYTNTGQLLAAEILCHEAIRISQENMDGYLLGVGLNTLAIVELTADRPHRAMALAKQALEIFENLAESGNRRGMGLANLVLGKANRVSAQLGLYDAQKTTAMFEASRSALVSGYDTFKPDTNWHEPARELEALQALGCLYRQWAQWEKTRANGSPSLVAKLASDSQHEFERAIEKVDEKYVGVRADLYNDMAELFWVQEDKTRALEYADKSDNEVRVPHKNYFIDARKQPEEPWYQLYVILGKNELLRARIALKEGDLAQAARNYAAASAYFDRFEGDSTARELIARRTYRMYRDVLEAKLPRDEPRLSAREIDQFRQDVEKFQRQNLVPPWPHRTTTLGDNFNVIWSDLHRVLEL